MGNTLIQALLYYGAGVIFTVPVARSIYTKNMIKAIVNLGEMGYKINGKLFDEKGEYNVGESSFAHELLVKGTYYIPFINILVARLMRKSYIEKIYMDSEFNDALVPMTESEQALFDSCTNDIDKLKVMVINIKIDEIRNQFADILSGKKIYVENSPIIPLSYSYDEVMKFKQLNPNITFGNSNGRNVALLGVDPRHPFELITYGHVDDTKYEFNKYPEEEAKNMRYIVYPCVDLEEEKIDEIVEEIRNSRTSRIVVPTMTNNMEMVSKPKTLTREK